ncbi:Bug family tripartite tricarboxylate transporter substrate binding protein [Ottowia sp. VDI28]|uniref:Bug family tripartite tricarboxylate transporter substrate binding protein n=1 Tax=Ottowia sp. VDI28 TaxID=3133968 RepID=UPI003C3053C8
MKTRTLLKCMASLTLISAFAPALADNFPVRPLKIVVPFPAGGGSDIVARLLAKGMQANLGQPVLIENKGGAGTVIGTEAVAKSPGDGYTMLWMATPFYINATLVKKLPYDTLKDLTPVVDIVSGPLALVVNPSSPWKTLGDLVNAAKQAPGKLSYGSSGSGGSPHIATEMLAVAAGAKFTHVPYRGSAPAMNDLLAGQTQFQLDTITLLKPHIDAGKLRALAITGKKRDASLPNVPTIAESGYAGFEALSSMSLAVPSSTPADVVKKLNAAAMHALADKETRESLNSRGWDIIGNSADEAKERLASEIERWGKAVRASGASVE